MKKNEYRSEIKKIIKKIVKNYWIKELSNHKKINLSCPIYDEREIMNSLNSLLDMRISQGPKVKIFEKEFARYVGTKFAVAVNSGTSANMLGLAALMEVGKIKRGAEVIMPAATFSAVPSPALHLGLKPVFVDVEADTWNIDPKEIEKAITKKTRIIMVVHTFGNPANMVKIMRIAKKHNLLVLEDCCEAHGASIGKRKVGSFGDVATMSFFVAHNITTGEGGIIFAKNKKLFEIIASLREFGRLPADVIRLRRLTYKDKIMGYYDARYITTRLGYNVRMTDMVASLGIEQLKKLDNLNSRRQKVVKQYTNFLSPFKEYLQLPTIRKGTYHSFYGYTFVVRIRAPFTRRDLCLFLEKNGIETRPFFDGCLPDQPAFRVQPHTSIGRLPESRHLRDNALFIGCHGALTSRQIRHVKETFENFFQKYHP